MTEHRNDVRRLRIVMRQVATGGGIKSTEMTVDCPRTNTRVFIDHCIYCGDSEGMVLDPSGEESFVRCKVGCDGEARIAASEPRRPRATEVPVAAVMSRDVVFVEPTTTVETLAAQLVSSRISGVPVVDPDRGLVGIVSQTDLVRHQHEHEGEGPSSPVQLTTAEADALGIDDGGFVAFPEGTTVEQIMSPVVFAVPETASLATVSALMAQEGVHRVPVVSSDGRSLAGIVSSLDILRWIAKVEQLIVTDRWA